MRDLINLPEFVKTVSVVNTMDILYIYVPTTLLDIHLTCEESHMKDIQLTHHKRTRTPTCAHTHMETTHRSAELQKLPQQPPANAEQKSRSLEKSPSEAAEPAVGETTTNPTAAEAMRLGVWVLGQLLSRQKKINCDY